LSRKPRKLTKKEELKLHKKAQEKYKKQIKQHQKIMQSNWVFVEKKEGGVKNGKNN